MDGTQKYETIELKHESERYNMQMRLTTRLQVWTRMFTLIKKRNWLRKAKDRVEMELSETQLDKLHVCEEDIEDIVVRTEEQLEGLNKQASIFGCDVASL